ncbi:pyridoxamine 5'-phosphate oxidase family protein [Ochrobactrum sp. Q0168]|uniref:pyridoxamine 5'-phosphate oxidase family protein n=1 Tax=Ochrobactrum sp. Q0168 TaxID=2793241 RepID=UPI0018EC5541|nr:pyridoxamine 5'-phosphate oxidase family protein [Ochrobactrum sp. Q0168]
MDNVEEVELAAWGELEAAAASPESGFRYVNLCSVDAENLPQARMVVLRRTDVTKRMLELHTDTRSAKWREFGAHPYATLLGYCSQTRLQLRLQGTVELHAPGSSVAETAWEMLPARTRATYAGGPPGDELALATNEKPSASKPVNDADGKLHFGVLAFRAGILDWFQLRREGNRRARFTYDPAGVVMASEWINP